MSDMRDYICPECGIKGNMRVSNSRCSVYCSCGLNMSGTAFIEIKEDLKDDQRN
jgi:hypothetical protein